MEVSSGWLMMASPCFQDNAVNSADKMSSDDVELQKTMKQILMDIGMSSTTCFNLLINKIAASLFPALYLFCTSPPGRTFAGHQIFANDASCWDVFHVLVAYAQFNPSIGYCQGM